MLKKKEIEIGTTDRGGRTASLTGFPLVIIGAALFLISVMLTYAAFRYGLPPKEGLPIRCFFWWPLALPILLVGLPLEIDLIVALFQFPAMGMLVLIRLARYSWLRVLCEVAGAYFGIVVVETVVVSVFINLR